MAFAMAKLCDPGLYRLQDATQKARNAAKETPGFELEIVRYLQSLCAAEPVPLTTVFRGFELLGGMLDNDAAGGADKPGDEGRLITLLRPFLRSSDARIVSKCVLVLGRQSRNMSWLNGIMAEPDDRVRANLVESLWSRKEPEVETLLRRAAKDRHPRVAANAFYGLHLAGLDVWDDGLEAMLSHANPAFRTSAIWVLKQTALPDAPARLKQVIRDADPKVRSAAFAALVYLRDNASGKGASSPSPVPV